MTFTKEQLIEQATENLAKHRTAINHPLAAIDAELFRMALAGMEAQPVAVVDIQRGRGDGKKYALCFTSSGHSLPDDVYNLYTAPQPLTTSERAELENYRNAQQVALDANGLLRCPFCGGEPEEDAGGCSEYCGHEHQDYSISCKRCGAEVYCSVGSFDKADVPCSCHHDTRMVCVNKWNLRAAMQSGADMAAQLESARLHIAELEAAPPAPVGDGETPVPLMPDFPGRTLTQRECYRAGFEAGKALKDGWVACSERMPEGMKEVIISNGFDIGHGWWDGEFWQEWSTHDSVPGEVTHWQPLPAAPDFREIGNSSTKHFRENSEASTNCPCWCRTCRPVKMNDMRFVVCPDCGNKRCPHANDHRNACTGSNEPGQEGSAYPAAPQQEA